jgi:hypothetical protein
MRASNSQAFADHLSRVANNPIRVRKCPANHRAPLSPYSLFPVPCSLLYLSPPYDIYFFTDILAYNYIYLIISILR